MKKCPTCDKTFEDSMRFCQTDGTPLVDDAPAFDPYATIVSSPSIPVPTVPPESIETIEPAAESAPAVPFETPISEPEDVLDLPQADPLKTMYISNAEMQETFGGDEPASEDAADLLPTKEYPVPEPPSFSVPDVPVPIFDDMTPPPSPFSASENVAKDAAPEPEPATQEPAPAQPAFDEPATMIQPAAFESPPPAPVAEWTPPPAPDASWQNQEIGSNTPFQPRTMGTGSKNQTLPIISLVLGILSLCCYVSPLTGIAALISGFLGLKNIKGDPSQYCGKGLAIAGMITGGLFLLLGIIYWIVIIFFGGLGLLMNR